MQSRLSKTLLFVLALLGQPTFVAQAADTVVVEVDTAQTQGIIRDVLGVNRKPGFADKSGSTQFDASALYSAFGISQVRLHDDDIDLCTTYTAARKVDASTATQVEVSGCKLQGTTAAPHLIWTPSSTADADLDNPDNYDFTLVDEAIRKTVATGAKVYLRLGESYNGPNDTDDPVAWAKVAANIYRHVIGVFKPTAGLAVDPAYVEVHNEPDGGFWRGTTTSFNTLFTETVNRVKSAASAAGHTVKVGGPGFTTNLLANASLSGNPANGFLTAVNASGPDFFSAHYYGSCSKSTLSDAATYLRNVRALVNSQGGSALPLQITEWNIGLGQSCGNAFYGEQRTRSYGSGVLTLMQDSAQNIEAAHFYAGVPIMALFDLVSMSGKALINPSSWAFWAHTKLRGATALSAKVCTSSGSCVAGYAAESAPLLALAGQSGSKQTVVITNDSASTANYTLRLKGLTSSSVRAVVLSPPDGVQQLALAGTPGAPDPSAVQALLGSVSQQTYESLAVSGGQAELTLSLPAYGVQVVEVTVTANATSYTVPGTLGNDVFVLTAGNFYYGGGGNDTYIISPNTLGGSVTAKIIDTEGDNLIQLVDGMTVTASVFYSDAAQLTLSNGAKVQILGASRFKFQLGANALAGDTATALTYTDFVTSLGASLSSGTLPASGSAGYVVPTGFTQATAPVASVAGNASTVVGTLGDDVLVPSGGNNYLGGGGSDSYIISPYTLGGAVTAKIIDTEGTNVIQLVGGLTIASSSFFNNAVQFVLSNGATVQILGASNFGYQLGANAPAGQTVSSQSYSQFAATLGASVPTGTTAVSGSANYVVQGSTTSGTVSASAGIPLSLYSSMMLD
ncbi:MAG: hypothetical protein IPH35_03305 [Rhodoferax sp.]|nr:hypothetical protein [Rhodoferax sp.]